MKKFLLPVVQILVTVALLWWIFRDPAKNQRMLEALHGANIWWLVPGFAALGLAILLQTQRWIILLRVQDIRLGWWRTWRLVMVGNFFNLFLLGATGGDVIKIFYAMREAPGKKSAAFLSVVFDRIIGLVALVAVAAVIVLFSLRDYVSHALTAGLLGTLGVILGGSLALVVAGFVVDRLRLADHLPTWLPLHARIVELAAAFSVYARDGRALLGAFLISIPAHLLIFSCFYFAARAFTSQLSLMNVYTVMPVVSSITALPISLSGVGVREQLFQQMFGIMFGVPESIAVPVSLAGFFITLLWGLIGGVVYVAYRPAGIHLSDMEREVDALEGEIEHRG